MVTSNYQLALFPKYFMCFLPHSVRKPVKSTEQLQMEEIRRLQLEAKKKLRSSRRSFMRLAKGGSKPVKVVKGSKPPTEVKEFSFSRAAGGEKSSGSAQQGEVVHPSNFASTLRTRHASEDCSHIGMVCVLGGRGFLGKGSPL